MRSCFEATNRPPRRCALAAGCAALLVLATTVHGAESPAALETRADQQLIDTVHTKALTVLRLSIAATNSTDLAALINAHTSDVVQAALPFSEPILILRGLSRSTGNKMALLNGRWFGVGDMVSTNGMKISEIGGDYVVLLDSRGLPRRVPL